MSVQAPSLIDSPSLSLQASWVECFRSVLSQVAGFALTVEPENEEESAGGEPALATPAVWVLFAVSKALRGEMAIMVPESGAVQLAQILMSEPPDAAAPLDTAHREGFEELLRQVVGQVATSLKSVTGGDVDIKTAGSTAPVWQNATRVGLRISGGTLAPIRLQLVVSVELIGGFPTPQEKSAPTTQGPNEGAAALQPDSSAAKNSNLELLLDVTVDATICFGHKRMLLREILDLHPGAAVTLDRHVEEPVDLLVGGRMVARGEVVVVDGNYGLRVTEIVSPQQRIASLAK